MESTIPNTISRRQFLRGKFRKNTDYIRPPWALPEEDFLKSCTRCKECIDKCPENIIVKGEDGFPTINFSLGACTFCKVCAETCESGALSLLKSETPWNLDVNVSNDCLSRKGVTCRSCADNCEQEAILFKPQVGGISDPVIEKSLCIGCGSCVEICPVKAVNVLQSRSSEESNYEHD